MALPNLIMWTCMVLMVLMVLPWTATGFNFSVGENEEVGVTFRDTVQLNMTVYSSNRTGVFKLQSADTNVIVIKDDEVELSITGNTTFPFTKTISLHGQFVGRSKLKILHSSVEISSVVANVHTPFQELGTVATIILASWLVISYVVMAAKVEPKVLIEKIKPPWALLLGMMCQFVLMPPVAYALCKVFDLRGAAAVGLVLVGTCPGGFFSNIEILLLDCDIVLSLAMTTFSTFISVGMMPLNLLIYAQPFIEDDGRLRTPFKELLIQLAGLVLPLVIGVPFFYMFPKIRKYCLKLVKPFTFILMVLGVVLYIPAQYYVFFGDWKVWVTSSIVTLIGAFFGMGVARIANFDYVASVTIAIETGCQNTLLAVSVAKLFYVAPESDVVAIIPLLIAIVSGIEGFAVILLYYLYLYIKKKPKVAPAESVELPEGEKPPGVGTSDAELNSLAGKDNKCFADSFVTPEDNSKTQNVVEDEKEQEVSKRTSQQKKRSQKPKGYVIYGDT